jgi:hypothetical protein
MYRRTAQLLEAGVGDELVALDPDKGSCFGFNSVAASVWRALEQPRSFDELSDRLLDEYEVDRDQCRTELAELLEQMTSNGLVERTAEPG